MERNKAMATNTLSSDIKAYIDYLVDLKVSEILEAKEVKEEQEWVGIDVVKNKTGWGRSTIEKWMNDGKILTMRASEGSRGKILYNLPDVYRHIRVTGKKLKTKK